MTLDPNIIGIMLEKDKLNLANYYYEKGNGAEAIKIFFDIYTNTKSDYYKLQSILGLIILLNSFKEMHKIIKLCEEGIALAQSLNDDRARIYLMSQKAHLLGSYNSLLIYERKNIILPRDLIGFSLERDKFLYDKITEEINKNEIEIVNLFASATQLAERISDKSLLIELLLAKGQYYGGKILDYKMENMRRSKYYKIFKFINLENLYSLDHKDRKIIKDLFTKSCQCFKDSINLAFKAKDYSRAAFSMYNFSIELKTENKFHKAKKYLLEAKKIADKYNIAILLPKIIDLRESIKKKNRDIPNYLEET